MLNVKVKNMRTIWEEVKRLEELREQMAKCRDYQKKEEYYKNLKQCKQELNKLILEKPLNQLQSLLTIEEMEMAENYYYKGMTWREAFETSSLFKETYDDEDDKEITKHINRNKKYIKRKIQDFYNFYK